MRYVDLEQRTPEWKRWRMNGITATEVAAVMNRNPYPSQTPWRLWCEKVGKALPPDLDNLPQVRYGQEHEADARRLFELAHAEVLFPACAEYEADPLFRCSFDGLTSAGEPVEFKCPSRTTLEEVRDKGTESRAVGFYRLQVQFQLLVSEARRGMLVFYDEYGSNGAPGLIEFLILRDDELIGEMLRAGRTFWDTYVSAGKEPPKDPERDIYTPKSDEDVAKWCRLAADFASAQHQAAALQKELDAVNAVKNRCKSALAAMMGPFRCADFAGVALTRRASRGAVDHGRLLQYLQSRSVSLTEKDLDAFRKEGAESWLIRTTDSLLPQDFVDPNREETVRRIIEDSDEAMWY